MSNLLFELIQSLTPTEKAYFKKFYQKYAKKENNKYIDFFDVLAKMSTYEKEKVQYLLKKINILKIFPPSKTICIKLFWILFNPSLINKMRKIG